MRATPTHGKGQTPVPTRAAAADVMPTAVLVHHAQEALLLVVVVSLPALAVAALVGLVVAALQAASQIQDATLAYLPRLLAVIVALALVGPWMGGAIAAFARNMFMAAG
jgi:type III secretion HrpO family protein